MPFRFSKPAATSEDILNQLVNYDVVILVDDSGSMSGKRWKQAERVLKGVVEKAIQYDKNGIEIQFLNSGERETVKSKKEVGQLFKKVEPVFETPLGKRLRDICDGHLHDLTYGKQGLKRCLIVAITDGAPSDTPRVYAAIKETAKRLDKLEAPLTQLGIQFVQIGDSRHATSFLKELDDNLKGEGENQVGRDIVDTVPYTGADLTSEQLVKILVGAINRKVDKQS